MGAPITILSQAQVHEALLGRVNTGKFAGRHTYVGGSEVGGCAREVCWKKIDPERARIGDPQAAGRILAGQILENAVVQIVRDAFGGIVRETGHAQAELEHATAPLKCHPDGRLQWQVRWEEGMQLVYLAAETGEQIIVDTPPVGPGTLEIKTAGGSTFRKYVKQGLPPRYLDQTQVEMGLSSTGWTLVVLVNREDLSQFVTFLVFFDENRYQSCVDRSTLIMNAVASGELPAPEPERGWCSYCDHRNECPSYSVEDKTVDSDAVFPEDVAVDVEVKAEEYLELKPLIDRADKLKDELKNLFLAHSVESAFGVYVSKTEGRTTVDTKRLQSDYPDIYNALLKKGAASFSLKVARKRANNN